MAVNERQQRFVDHYIASGNVTQAAISAGYSEGSAHVTGARLLRNAKIAAAIEKRNKELESDRIADMAEVKEFWTEVLRDGEADMSARLKASEFIAKTNAAFVDRVQSEGDVTIRVTLDDDDES